jgi:hypothetical protein
MTNTLTALHDAGIAWGEDLDRSYQLTRVAGKNFSDTRNRVALTDGDITDVLRKLLAGTFVKYAVKGPAHVIKQGVADGGSTRVV